ncbi:MAG: protease modulator HflK, partial [Gammaproteobacteria bacterium]
LLTEYERAPAVTRERLYLDTMETVLANTNKVFIDSEGNNSLMYLPIDKLLENSNRNRNTLGGPLEPVPSSSSLGQTSQGLYDRADRRERGVR